MKRKQFVLFLWFLKFVWITNYSEILRGRIRAHPGSDFSLHLMFSGSFEISHTNVYIAFYCISNPSCQYTILFIALHTMPIGIKCQCHPITRPNLNQSIFFIHLVMSALEIMLANLRSQSAIYRGFRSLDTAVLFVIECLSLLQTRIWGHSVFAFSFSWSLLNRLSDMPD